MHSYRNTSLVCLHKHLKTPCSPHRWCLQAALLFPAPRFQQAFGRLDGIISLCLLRTSDLIQPVLIHSSLLLPLTVGKLRWSNSPELLLQLALTCSCSLPCASWCLWGCAVSQGKVLPETKDLGFSDLFSDCVLSSLWPNPYYSCRRQAPSTKIQSRDKFLLWYRAGLAY